MGQCWSGWLYCAGHSGQPPLPLPLILDIDTDMSELHLEPFTISPCTLPGAGAALPRTPKAARWWRSGSAATGRTACGTRAAATAVNTTWCRITAPDAEDTAPRNLLIVMIEIILSYRITTAILSCPIWLWFKYCNIYFSLGLCGFVL